MNYEEFLAELVKNADDAYRDFSSKAVLTERPFLGVRTPKLREIAREIIAGKYSETPADQIKIIAGLLSHEPVSREEVLVRGFVIARLPYEDMVLHMDKDYLPFVDSWEACDVFCASIRKAVLSRKNGADHREDFLKVVDQLLSSPHEFYVRTGLVCLLDFYITPEYLPVILIVSEKLPRVMSIISRWQSRGCSRLAMRSYPSRLKRF
ncbi:DNA alkylation repair protein [Candidatus Saccharibacteria bacterium]|nr:DNA alkylation repair protein [Candidatus Saccharibacteria bacterium]